MNYAASRGEVKIVKKLIGLGVDVNSQGDQGYTPLQEAASKGYIDVVKLLVDHGADLDLKMNSEKTPQNLPNQKVRLRFLNS
ncbi:ankyrin repeat domain-containing protein [Rahnella sp. LAC-M12]|uniref:Ankyrin repeat domain-containing protein n=1 Tax=Rahnella laticis TaxID=2787622 RepID=A0ABS0EAF7_9GAMM|nr:ankyrin repeat domain-containing protein [Rahnella laticis]MBF8001651.1 ankyrin repeat domain-containing protein [Rahnella sp. LAC-M12]